jgi:hypothetical protein
MSANHASCGSGGSWRMILASGISNKIFCERSIFQQEVSHGV